MATKRAGVHLRPAASDIPPLVVIDMSFRNTRHGWRAMSRDTQRTLGTIRTDQGRWDHHLEVIVPLAVNNRHPEGPRRVPRVVQRPDVWVDEVYIPPQSLTTMCPRHPRLRDGIKLVGFSENNAVPAKHVRMYEYVRIAAITNQ
jgi:hypothetical protein